MKATPVTVEVDGGAAATTVYPPPAGVRRGTGGGGAAGRGEILIKTLAQTDIGKGEGPRGG